MILCGVYADENVQEVVSQASRPVEISANRMQQKLIAGFYQMAQDVSVISAPMINAFPVGSKTVYFKGFSQESAQYTYVHFHNTWGIRNISRTKALKKALKTFIADPQEEKAIVVYCPHTPFIEAAVYAKKQDPKIQLCLYVPDLPQYMNLAKDRSVLYDFFKKYDIAAMTKGMQEMDAFVLLTEQMKSALPVGEKPYFVAEGIVDKILEPSFGENQTKEKYIVYTGKLYEQFGVKNLIDAFSYIEDPDYRLVLCGSGDCDAYAAQAAKRDNRICVMGQVLPEEALLWQKKACALVNPRPNDGEYTKYSFPSKNIEYLLAGKPTVAYLLDGMPAEYAEFMVTVSENEPSPQAIAKAIQFAAAMGADQRKKQLEQFLEYAKQRLLAEKIAAGIIGMLEKDR